ncbi:MAG: acyl-CoA dehydrogenase family protein [Solirubrobacteraceae bacterium]|nr:acyl-CoA dehydrogenase family protein [Patulibacter sp.]
MSVTLPHAALMPPFTEEHEELRRSIRGFVERELTPHVEQWEADKWFPNEVFHKLAAQGFIGLKFGEEYGGEGGDHLHAAILCEELSRTGSAGLAVGICAHVDLAMPPINGFGTEDQKQRYLVPAIKAEKIGALAITEPGAGSDVANIQTRAEKVDGGWIVNGEKVFITNGVRADFYVAAVKTTPEGGHGGMSFLIIDKGEGVTATALSKLGWHCSDTGAIAFQDVFVPDENLLGEVNGGFKLIMENFQWERLVLSMGAIAGAQAGLELTLEYVKQREAFGRPIGTFQVNRHTIAQLATELYAARAQAYDALRKFVAGENAAIEVSMVKLFSQRICLNVADECVQLHGGAGYMSGPIERGLRDARLGPIGGGTDQVMREIIGRSFGL